MRIGMSVAAALLGVVSTSARHWNIRSDNLLSKTVWRFRGVSAADYHGSGRQT